MSRELFYVGQETLKVYCLLLPYVRVIAQSLPGKSFTLSLFMTSFSLDVKAFFKCHFFLEAFADFSYEKNPQFPAQSPSQLKK